MFIKKKLAQMMVTRPSPFKFNHPGEYFNWFYIWENEKQVSDYWPMREAEFKVKFVAWTCRVFCNVKVTMQKPHIWRAHQALCENPKPKLNFFHNILVGNCLLRNESHFSRNLLQNPTVIFSYNCKEIHFLPGMLPKSWSRPLFFFPRKLFIAAFRSLPSFICICNLQIKLLKPSTCSNFSCHCSLSTLFLIRFKISQSSPYCFPESCFPYCIGRNFHSLPPMSFFFSFSQSDKKCRGCHLIFWIDFLFIPSRSIPKINRN